MSNAPRHKDGLFGENAPRPLQVDAVCSRCDRESRHEVPWAMLHPEPERCAADGWDGVFLGRAVACPACGGVDDYALTSLTKLALLARAAASPAAADRDRAGSPR